MAPEPTRHYRWALGLFGGFLAGGLVLAIVLAATMTDANAGLPALFFGSLFIFAAVPVSAACAVQAYKSLSRREPYRRAVIGVLVLSGLFFLNFAGSLVVLLKAVLHPR